MDNYRDLWDDGDSGPISDINVTPFIDIMLVLLIIFMVTAPLMLGGIQVNLPKSGGDPMPRPENPIIVSLDAEQRIYVDKEELPATGRHERFQKLAVESAGGEVFVRGDGEVKYARMMELMAELGRAGFARVTLVTDLKLDHRSLATGQAGTSAVADVPVRHSPIGAMRRHRFDDAQASQPGKGCIAPSHYGSTDQTLVE